LVSMVSFGVGCSRVADNLICTVTHVVHRLKLRMTDIAGRVHLSVIDLFASAGIRRPSSSWQNLCRKDASWRERYMMVEHGLRRLRPGILQERLSRYMLLQLQALLRHLMVHD